MSFGWREERADVRDATDYAWGKGSLLVAASGNNGIQEIEYPGNYSTVIAVGAINSSDQRWIGSDYGSNYGDKLELVAPGVDVYSTLRNNSYDYETGTSMAVPHVSGVAALVWSQYPALSNNEVRQILTGTADDLGSSGRDIYYGYGKVNAYRAVSSYLSGWNYRKLKTITGTTAGAQTNYQMKLKVYNSAGTDTPSNIYLGGNAKSDFSDLRFTKSDGVTLLDYWIESYTPGVNATVWVEVDSIPASPNTASIFIYYGNSQATSLSNIHNTFLFGDDFEDNSWTTNNWNLFTGGYTLVSTTQRDGSTGKVLKSNSSSSQTHIIANAAADNIVIETNVKPLYDSAGTINYGITFRDSSNLNTINYFKLEYLNWGPAGHNLHYLGCGSETRLTGAGWTINNWHILQAQISGSSLVMKLYDSSGNLMQTITKTTSCGITNTWLGIYSGDYSGNTAYYDAFRVRKYASPEPAWGS